MTIFFRRLVILDVATKKAQYILMQIVWMHAMEYQWHRVIWTIFFLRVNRL
jgi:hypothetical protein